MQQWLQENSDELADLFMHYGLSRSLLSMLHGFELTVKTGVQQLPTLDATVSSVDARSEYSHATLNEMAQAWQDLCLHRLELIETCQLMESKSMSDDIYTSGSLTSTAIPEEVTMLAKKLAAKHGPVTITNEASGLHIYIPDPELLIRTSGELRLSNYLLWQLAYTELYFTDTLWPDFREESLYEAIVDYQKRERRFGKISEQLV